MQAGGVIAGADGVTHTHVTCFCCEHKGHYADKCPDGPNATLLQTEAAATVTLLQASHTEAIIAADNANSVSVFTFTQLPSRHELLSPPLSLGFAAVLHRTSIVVVFVVAPTTADRLFDCVRSRTLHPQRITHCLENSQSVQSSLRPTTFLVWKVESILSTCCLCEYDSLVFWGSPRSIKHCFTAVEYL